MRRGLISVAIFVAFVVILTLSRHVIDTTSTTTTTTTVHRHDDDHRDHDHASAIVATTCQASDFSGRLQRG